MTTFEIGIFKLSYTLYTAIKFRILFKRVPYGVKMTRAYLLKIAGKFNAKNWLVLVNDFQKRVDRLEQQIRGG